MPDFLSLRNFRLETTHGHTIVFKANTPTFVPDAAVPAAMAAGCVPVDQAGTPFHEDNTKTKVEFAADARESLIYLAVKRVVERNNNKDFDGSGVPKLAAINSMLGFDVIRKEVSDVFRLFMQNRTEGREYALHPNAERIMQVLDADTKAELLELAEAAGVEDASGMTVRDLRRNTLVKLSGFAAI